MRFYVAGSVKDQECVGSVVDAILDAGHALTVDWRDLSLRKPYRDHVDVNSIAAKRMVQAVRAADHFVLVLHPELWGANIERGIAHASHVYVHLIGNVRQSAFDCLIDTTIYESAEEFCSILVESELWT